MDEKFMTVVKLIPIAYFTMLPLMLICLGNIVAELKNVRKELELLRKHRTDC